MNKKILRGAAVAAVVILAAGTACAYKAKTTSVNDGAAIELKGDEFGFACSCGCMDDGKSDTCNCGMEDCDMNKNSSEEDDSEDEDPQQYFYQNKDTGEMIQIEIPAHVEPISKDEVKELVARIEECDTLCIRRCESLITDDGKKDPSFDVLSESRYYYDKTTNIVLNSKGEDITDNLSFKVSWCKDSYDFLEKYLKSVGMPTDFTTDDTSHVKDLLMNQRVYSFGLDKCQDIKNLEEKMDGVIITQRDCTYQVKTFEDGIDRILYITVTVAGNDAEGKTVVRYVTYILDYNPDLPEREGSK